MSEPLSLAEEIRALGEHHEQRIAELDANYRKMGKIVYHLILQSGKTEATVPKDFEKDWMIVFDEQPDCIHLKIGKTGPMTPIEFPQPEVK